MNTIVSSDDEKTPQIVPPHTVWQNLEKRNVLWLIGEVNDQNTSELSARMLQIAAENQEDDIYLFINSPGGSITAGVSLYDTMALIPNDVVTVGTGMAASMGQFLLTMGAPGKRYITPNARVLLHQPHGGFGGTTSDIVTQSALISNMKEQLATLTAERTNKTLEQVHADGDRDRWYTAPEALGYGFVDHILTDYMAILSNLPTAKEGK